MAQPLGADAEPFTISTELPVPDVCVLRVSGELDLATAPRLHTAALDACAADGAPTRPWSIWVRWPFSDDRPGRPAPVR